MKTYSLDNIKKLMSIHNIGSEIELSRQTDIPSSTLNRILSGASNDPRLSLMKTLAKFFNVTIDELIGDVPLRTSKLSHIENSLPANDAKLVPLIHWEQVPKFEMLVEKLSPSVWDKWVLTNEDVSPRSYALNITTKTAPLPFVYGTKLIVDPEAFPEDGDIVVFFYKDNEAFVRLAEYTVLGSTKCLNTLDLFNDKFVMDSNIVISGVIQQWQTSVQK